MNKVILFLLVILSGYVSFSASAVPLVVQTQTIPVTTVPKIKSGTTELISSDWQKKENLQDKPDNSYKTIWVRMFPIVSTPYRDPYPIAQNMDYFSLYNSKNLIIRSSQTGEVLAEAKHLVFDLKRQKVILNKRKVMKLEKVWIVAKDNSIFTTAKWDLSVKGKINNQIKLELRGGFVVDKTFGKRDSEKRWSLINVLSIEEYLYSVIPSEMPLHFESEALKTQAVAARTYALYEMAVARGDVVATDEDRESKKKENEDTDTGEPKETDPENRTGYRGWDVNPTTWFQSYRGVVFQRANHGRRKIEDVRALEAVNATSGLVLTYNDEIIKAFFSAHAGGQTCTAKECFGWGKNSINPGYLQPVKEDPDVFQTPLGVWGEDAKITKKSISNKLKDMKRLAEEANEPGNDIEDEEPLDLPENFKVKELFEGEISSTGRVWNMVVRLESDEEDGESIILTRRQTKRMLSLFGRIRAHLFELTPMENNQQTVLGHGYGHGVGMSQWGARVLAIKGFGFEEILKFYYTDVELMDIRQLDDYK